MEDNTVCCINGKLVSRVILLVLSDLLNLTAVILFVVLFLLWKLSANILQTDQKFHTYTVFLCM